MVTEYRKRRPARLALFIAIALAGYTQHAYSRDLFNPELVELDNPSAGKVDLSHFESAPSHRGPIMSIFCLTINGWSRAMSRSARPGTQKATNSSNPV
jgi:hypothetical protein